MVQDGCQGQGLGRHLMERLMAVAKERGVRRIEGQVLAENTPMLGLMRKLGFTPGPTADAGVVSVGMDLDPFG